MWTICSANSDSNPCPDNPNAGSGSSGAGAFHGETPMPQLGDITLYTLTRTMNTLDQLYQQEPDVYEDFVREICADFTLAREYMLAIQEMAAQNLGRESMAQADLTLKHLLAVWVLSNDLAVPLAGMEQVQ